VYFVYYGPNDKYAGDSPGTTSTYNGKVAAPIYAGVTIDPNNSDYEDQGLFGFKPGDVPVATFASQALTYDFVNQYGTAPVWVYIELNKNDAGQTNYGAGGDVVYQYLPGSNTPSWHTENPASAATWLKWSDWKGTTTGSPLTLLQIATDNPGKTVSRVYLTEGMGDSYHSTSNGTVAWVDTVTIGSITYDFVLDKTAPTVGAATITPINNGAISGISNISAAVTGTNLDQSSCEYTLNGTNSFSPSIPGAYNSSDGKCEFTGVDTSSATSIGVSVCNLAGGCTNGALTPVTVDKTAPTTTDNIDANWHNGNVTVTLTCTDNPGGIGCSNTYYTTDGSTPTTSSSSGNSFTLSSDGTYTVKYFSVDSAGNTELVKTAANQVKIDRTAPTVTFVDPTPSDGLVTNNNNQTFTVSVSEPVNSCTLNFNGNYTESQIPNGLSDGTGFTTLFNQIDDGATLYTLPFSFPFYGNSYNSLSVSTNALLRFASSPDASWSNSVSGLMGKIGIAPLWADLVTTVSVIASASDVRFRWTGTGFYAGGTLTNEAVLRSNGQVEFDYGNVNLPSKNITAGLSAGNGVDYVLSSVNGQSVISPSSFVYSPGAMGSYPMTINPDDTYSVTVSNIQDGVVNFSVSCADLATNEGKTSSRSMTVDTSFTTSNPPSNQGGPGDGLSDGRSDGLSSCPSCTQAPALQGSVLGLATGLGGAQTEEVLGEQTQPTVLGTATNSASPTPSVSPMHVGRNSVSSSANWVLEHKKISLTILLILALIAYFLYRKKKKK